jgi:phosphomannomutase
MLSAHTHRSIGCSFHRSLQVEQKSPHRDHSNGSTGGVNAGADVTDIGMVSTDALYFAVAKYEFAGGIMITASHNPA